MEYILVKCGRTNSAILFNIVKKAVDTPPPPLVIGPEFDHWLCLSLTDSLTHSRLVNLIDVTMAWKDTNSKLVEVVTVADVDDKDRVGNSLLQIWDLTFGPKSKLLFRLWAQGFVKSLKLK